MKFFGPSKIRRFFVLFLVLFFIFGFKSSKTSAEGVIFARSLGVGSSGADVFLLQQFLNENSETQVALSGPGSPNFETFTFGGLTRLAVNKFQKKYASEILSIGQAPTGFVGPRTLKMLNTLQQKKGVKVMDQKTSSTIPVIIQTQSTATQTQPTTTTSSISIPKNTNNPNFVNLDRFISDVEKIGKKQGYAEEKLLTIKEGIINVASTTKDFRILFQEMSAKKTISNSNSKIPSQLISNLSVGNIFRELLTSLGIIPEKANAQLPFGTFAIYYTFFCPCSGNFLIGMFPLPPTFLTLASYYPGSQMFLNYNAPFTMNMLGTYTPGAGYCLIPIVFGCIGLPTEGLIDPFLGTS